MATERRLGVNRQSHLLFQTGILQEFLDSFEIIPFQSESDKKKLSADGIQL